MHRNSVNILGIYPGRSSFIDIAEQCEQWLLSGAAIGHRIVTVNPEFLVEAQKNEQFRNVLATADIRIADGIGLVFASFFLYGWNNRLHRCTGVDFTWKLAEMCHSHKKTMYLVGGRDGIAVRTAHTIEKKFPGIIAGAEVGLQSGRDIDTDEAQSLAVCERIRAAQPDILLVALGAPRQDLWIAEYLSILPSVRIAIGVGGTFDYLAGVVPRAPSVVRKLGLEWFYRLICQPHRLNRIITATIRFPFAVVRQKYIK